TSRGTHGLLKQGAKLTETVDDILDELLPQLEQPIIRRSLFPGSAAGASERRPSSYEPANFSPEEEKVYAVVSCEPQSIDELSERAALASSRVACALLSLELKDAVRQAPGQRYHRSI